MTLKDLAYIVSLVFLTLMLLLAIIAGVPFVVFWAVDVLIHYKIDYGLKAVIAYWILYLIFSPGGKLINVVRSGK